MTSMILAAGALIWMCQPSRLIRFDSGSIMSGMVAPPGAQIEADAPHPERRACA